MGGKALSFGLIYWVELLVRESSACADGQTRHYHGEDENGEEDVGYDLCEAEIPWTIGRAWRAIAIIGSRGLQAAA